MQIVIDIPEKSYTDIRRIASVQMKRRFPTLEQIVANGTPLPKHGRLIDADALKECEQKWSCDYESDGYSHVVEIRDIDNAPTIIEKR